MGNRTKLLIATSVGGLAAIFVGVFVVLPNYARYRARRDRKNWKEQALPAIRARVSDNVWIAQELAGANSQDFWVTDEMLVMADGQWLVFRAHCSKAKPHHIKDIFLARGSNGKWYYSTFHFCVGMFVLCSEEQPPDLATFVRECNLYEFDGKSDQCLQETAPFFASGGWSYGSSQ